MATALWPGTLAQEPAAGGWSWKPQPNKAVFQPDVGPSIERRRATDIAMKYDARFPALTDALVATFETFYLTTLEHGTLHYIWDDPVSGTPYKWRIGEYQITNVAKNVHDLTMSLTRLPGFAYGAELIVNGDFSGGSTGWNLNLWTVSAGKASENANGSTLWQTIGLTVGQAYKMAGVMSDRTAGSVTVQFLGGTTVNSAAISADGAFTEEMVAVTGNTRIDFNASSAFVGKLDDLSLVPIL